MPFALDNVRIADLTWLLAGAGGPRMLTSLGAEDIRIEWKGHLDMIRASAPIIPVGAASLGRARELTKGSTKGVTSLVSTRANVASASTFVTQKGKISSKKLSALAT